MELIEHEVIRALGLDVPGRQDPLWEVLEVASHDDLGPCLDSRGEDVAIVWIRKLHRVDQRLVADDKAVADGCAHQSSSALQTLRIKVGQAPQDGPKGLVKDRVGPLRLDQARLRDADQQIAQGRRGCRTLAS